MRCGHVVMLVGLLLVLAGCAAMGELTGKAVRTTDEAVQDFKAGYSKGRGK